MRILVTLGCIAASLCVLPWSRWALIPIAIMVVVVFAVKARPRIPHPLIVIAGVLLMGYALYATLAPPWEADFLADWGVKGRTFWEAGGIDWKYLQTETSVHPDYPPLVPLLFDFVAIASGGWNDALFGLINVAFALGLLVVIHGVALEENGSKLTAAIVTAIAVPLAATPWIGIADGPLIAYATSGLLLMRRHPMAASVMLGFAAATKNEGLTLILAVAIAMIVLRRDVRRLWPAVVIALPWLICRLVLHLQSDLTFNLSRIFERLSDPGSVVSAFMSAPFGRPLFLVALLVGLVIAWRRVDKFVLTAVGIQFLFYIAVYLATPHDITWHVRWSWERLIAHLTPSLAIVILLANARAASPRVEEPSSSALPA